LLKDNENIGLYPYKAMLLDNVHGFIPINKAEYWLLQTPFFRRLHNIKQLGANYLVFPSAKHTRLEHSLGCMHIASRIANKLLDDALSEKNSKLCAAMFNSCNEKAYRSFIQVARLTGLLHDIGHLALSHMVEPGINNVLAYSKEDTLIEDEVAERLTDIYYKAVDFGLKLHEFYTYYFTEKLIEMAGEVPLENLDLLIEASLSSLFPKIVCKRGCSTLEELGLTKDAANIIRGVISNEIVDADRLDYLQRDAMATGIVYGNIDIDRLVYGIKLGYEKETDKLYLTLDMKSVPTLEDIFDARYKMYKSVYYHHKSIAVGRSVEKFIYGLVDEWNKVKLDIYGDIDVAGFLDPKKLSEAIAENLYYFDDNEFDTMVKISLNKGSKLLRRWALSLLSQRELLPLSIIKRPEQVMIMASHILEKRGIPTHSENLKKLIKGIDKHGIEEEIKESTSVPSAKIDFYEEEIISEQKIMETSDIFNWKESMYIKGLVQTGYIPVLYVYIYSDDMDDHITLKNRIGDIRKKAVEILENFLEEKSRELFKR